MIAFGSPAPEQDTSWRRLPRLVAGSFRLVWQAAPREFTISVLLQLLQGASLGVTLLVVRNVLAAILAGAPRHDYLPAFRQLGILIVLQAAGNLAIMHQTMQQQVVTELVQRHASRPVTEVASTIGLRDFDTPEFHDRMQRAQQTAMMRPFQVTQAVLGIGRGALGLVGLLTNQAMAKEVRAFGLGGYFRQVYEELSEERLQRLRQHLRHRTGLSAFGSPGTAASAGGTFAALAWLISTGIWAWPKPGRPPRR